MERPTYQQVREMLQERRSILGPMHAAMQTDEDWFDAGTSDAAKQRVVGYLKGLPIGYREFVKLLPYAYLGVMVGVNQIHVGESVEARARIPGGVYSEDVRKEREALLRQWLTGLIYTMDTFSPDSVVRELVTKLIGLGMGCLSYNIAYDRWPAPPFGYVGRGKDRRPREPDKPKDREKYHRWQQERARAFPFTIEAVHPLNLFFDPHHVVPEDFIREEVISFNAALKIAPELGKVQPVGDQAQRATRTTYVSSEWIGQWVNEEPILKGRDVIDGVGVNHSGLPLHRMAFGGFGTSVRSGDFASKGKGIIRDGRDLIIMKMVLMNTIDRIRGVIAFPPMEVIGDDPAERMAVMQTLTYGPGELLEHSTRVSLQPVPEIHIPSAVLIQSEQIDAGLETHFGPQILRGQGSPQETAQGQRNRFTIATSIYRAAQQAAQQCVQAVLMDLLYLVKYELREPCPVMMGDGTVVSIGPDDIDDGVTVVVDFTPPTDDEKAFRAENDRKDLEMGIITPQQYAERQGYDNPKAQVRSVRVEKVVDMIIGLEPVIMAVANPLLQSLGGAPGVTTGGMPSVEATPSGQPVQAQPGTAAGNPSQQRSSQNMQDAYAPPVQQ